MHGNNRRWSREVLRSTISFIHYNRPVYSGEGDIYMKTRSRITTLLIFAFASLAFASQSLSQTEGKSAEGGVSQRRLAARGTDEQNLLELAYGKLILYVKAGHAFRAVRTSEGYSTADELSLELQNIHTAPVAEQLDKPSGHFWT